MAIKNAISVNHLTKIYKKNSINSTVALNELNLEVKQGEIFGLLGPNGAGKTTTFYMIVGLVKPDQGTVFLEGTDITKVPMYKRARMGLGYLPQESSIFKKLSVEDNILMLWEIRKNVPIMFCNSATTFFLYCQTLLWSSQ